MQTYQLGLGRKRFSVMKRNDAKDISSIFDGLLLQASTPRLSILIFTTDVFKCIRYASIGAKWSGRNGVVYHKRFTTCSLCRHIFESNGPTMAKVFSMPLNLRDA